MYILGINPYHPDSSATLIKDGKLVAAVEEERFTRIKHWAGFPRKAIMYCLKSANISFDDVNYIAINKNPYVNFLQKVKFFIKHRPDLKMVFNKLKKDNKLIGIKEELHRLNGNKKVLAKIYYVEHHVAHAASAFFVSPFDESAILTIDGSGDFVTTMLAVGRNSDMKIIKKIYIPHSMGNFYMAITQFLGFKRYGDEYKVMGLSPYGKPKYKKEFEKLVYSKANGVYKLNFKYFVFNKKVVNYSKLNEAPNFSDFYDKSISELLGFPRVPGTKLINRYKDIAATLQAKYEDIFFKLLNDLYNRTGIDKLCLAGGSAMNSAANGKIFERTKFKDVYIQAAAGDNGGSLGAAFYVYHSVLKLPRKFYMETAYWGPKYTNKEIKKALYDYFRGKEDKIKISLMKEQKELVKKTAKYISKKNVVGWFQGRMELGARALGNRSILCDPRHKDMKDILNARIKKRESFRPFAPTILRAFVKDYFEYDKDVPFMSQVFKIKENKRKYIPAVTHVDGTARLQTVTKKQNKIYYELIKEFYNITGIPILLNTSFNENEPIVNTPFEAIDCFWRTKMDILVIGDYIIEKK